MVTKPCHLILSAITVAALDTAAAVLGICAQSAQNASKHVKVLIYECIEPSHTAFKLGLSALIILIVAHFITVFFSRCTSVRLALNKTGKSSWKMLSGISLFWSWLTFLPIAIAFGLGIYTNHPSSKTCGFAHLGLLLIGGLSCFAHSIFCFGYYCCTALVIRSERKMTAAAAAPTARPVP